MNAPTPAPADDASGPTADGVMVVAPAAGAALLSAPAAAAATHGRWIAAGAVALTAVSVAALTIAWDTQQRLQQAEALLVKRQQEAGGQSAEARALAREAENVARQTAARIALLEARVAETTLQRSQLEELIQSMSRSRDENVLADVDAAVRVAMQQAAITGSVEPLAAALRQADERLARYQQPRLDRVRRAVLQDLDRVKAAGAVDLPTLAIRIDEAVRVVDELPLLTQLDSRRPARREAAGGAAGTTARAGTEAAASPGAASASASSAPSAWTRWFDPGALGLLDHVWAEVRSLVRVTRIDNPEAALLAPEQGFFVRENLKLRLLNARLALMSRQFDAAQSDLREAQAMLERWFDRSSRRVQATAESLRVVGTQSRQISLPRPDATLAAVTAAVAGR